MGPLPVFVSAEPARGLADPVVVSADEVRCDADSAMRVDNAERSIAGDPSMSAAVAPIKLDKTELNVDVLIEPDDRCAFGPFESIRGAGENRAWISATRTAAGASAVEVIGPAPAGRAVQGRGRFRRGT